ncbi:MAG TPA: hypothetical protein VE890_03085 [Thermoguttaceae bacterium]|nr:hypothetical protein [Thermoguttaceae bacterium]
MKSILVSAVLLSNCLLCNAASLQADEATAAQTLRQAGYNLKQTADGIEIGFGQPEWTPDAWQRLGEVAGLTTLRGTAHCADNAGLETLSKLPRLKILYLNGATFDDTGFATLAKIESLETLSLDHNQSITGSGAAALKTLPNLRSLRFGGCMKFTGDGVRASAELVQLQSLQLHHCGIGDSDLPPLTKMPNLKSLFVSSQFNGRFTAEGLKPLAQISTLESLKVAELVVTYDNGLDALVRLDGLKTLELQKVGTSVADIERLRAAMPEVEITWTPASDEEVAQFHRRVATAKMRSK